MTMRTWLTVLAAALILGCGDEGGQDYRFAVPTPSVSPTPFCDGTGACRTDADCLEADGICVPSARSDGNACFCRYTGDCRFRPALGSCEGFCGTSISLCIALRDLEPFGDPEGCLCEPPTPTPDPMSTPLAETEAWEPPAP